ncbi:MAG: hypothetical protein AABW48_02355 [Nanoarchaeota archaeon]|mgnify:CR=1 FL=1
MIWENLQWGLYLITLILAGTTALLGLFVLNKLFQNKLKDLFSNVSFFVFFLLIFGYSCFALGEVTWFLIFDVFKQMPSASMPDVYWVVGSVFQLLAYVSFSAYMFKHHGQLRHAVALLIFGGVVLAGVLGFIFGLNLVGAERTVGSAFLGYFYPLMTGLILIASLSVYLFIEKIGMFQTNFLFLFLANFAFLAGDLLYTYVTATGGYGVLGATSELLYIAAYLLCSLSFFILLMKTRNYSSAGPLKN